MRTVALLLLAATILLAGVNLLAKDASPGDLIRTGDAFFAKKTYKKALEAYESYLKAEPKGDRAHHARMRIAASLLGIRQRWQAVSRLKAFVAETEAGTLERAETARLLGATLVRHWGGRKETIAWLDEARAYFAAKKMTREEIGVLFDIAVGLSHAWGYDIQYAEWEKKHYRPDPDDVKVDWDDYRRAEMGRQDRERYARVVTTYETITRMAGDAADGPKALYRLGCFHVNVLASAFATNANYYAAEYEGEKPAEMAKALDRYHGEIRKGLAAWTSILEKHGESGYADDAQYLIAVTYHQRRNEFRAAVAEYESLLAAFPGSEWATTAKAAIQQIMKEEIRLQVDRPFAPGENPVLGFAARNVKKIRFRAYRLDMPALVKGAYRFHNLNGISVANLTPYKEWEIETGVENDHKGVQGPLKLPFAAAGAFLLVAEGDRSTCRALVVSSGIAMAMKTSPTMTLLYATDSVTGEPKQGVRFVLKANWRVGPLWLKKVYEATSDANGLARVELAGLPSRSVYVEAVGTHEDHVVLSRNYRSSPRTTAPYKVFTMTDRPVYRPNQTVHLKAIVRARGPDGFVARDGKAVLVEVQNPRGEKIFAKTLVTNEHGSISADLALDEEPPLGMYNVRTFIDGNQYYSVNWVGTQFRVEEYKKPEFEVTVTADAARVEPGSKVKAKVQATYYFGAPVAHGKLTYQVFRQPYRHFMPVKRRFQWYYGDIYPEPRHGWGRELVTEGDAALSDDGGFEIEFTAEKYKDGNDSQFVVEAKVTDQSRREIKGSAAIFSTVLPFFVQTESRRSLYKPGDRVEITIKAEDANKNPVASEGKLVLTKREDREEEKDGEKVTVTEWKEIGSVPAKTREDGTGTAGMIVDEPGHFTLSYVVTEGGVEIRHGTSFWAVTKDFRGSQYRFSNVEVLTDRDTYVKGDEIEVLVNSHVKDAWILLTVEAGSEVLFARVVKATGKSHLEKLTVDATWIPNVWVKALTIRDEAVFLNRRQIIVPPVSKFLDVKITPVKQGTYLPGEEAEFTVTATNPNGEPAEAELAVGFVDKSILYIQPEITPDIRKFFYGEKRGDRVRVSSSFDFSYRGSEQAKPGHSLTKYRTRGWPSYMRPWWYNFAGMTGELSLLYGRGVELLEKSQKGGPGRGGWGFTAGEGGTDGGAPVAGKVGAPPGTRSPAAPSKKSRKRRSGRPDESREMDEESADRDDFGGGGGGAAEPKVRKFFPDTAYWNAHVTTGKNGKATVKLTFPDSLTTWKATARGATALTSVGTGRSEFVTTKNIIIRLQAPRFFRERDELVVSGIVHNYFDEEVTVTALVTTEGGCLELLTDRGELSKPELRFKVAAKKEQRVDWWFRVTRPGRATIRIDARSKRGSDAMILEFPVYEHGVEKYIALSGSMTGVGGAPAGDGAAEMAFLVPDDRHEESTDLTVTVSPSIAAAMLETLPYLADYPYGCVEQTMSRFLPTVVVKKTLLDLGYTLEDLGVDPEREVPSGYWGRKEVQKLKVLREADLAKVVGAGLKRLADFQNGDGSWGWFKGSAADLRMTSYVVSGLVLAHRAGAPVDRNMIKRGATFLWRQVQGIDPDHLAEKGMPMSPDLLTSVVAVLSQSISMKDEAGARVTKLVEWIYDHRDELGAVSRGRLARVLFRIGKAGEARIVCENLTDQMELDRENGTCRFGRAAGYYRWYNDAVEATSETLSAYLVVEPKSELIPMMVKWLVGSRRGAHWKSTMDTAHAVLSLCDYLRVSKELAPDLTVTVRVGDRVTKTIRITKENVFTLDNTLTIRGADLPGGKHVVSITKKGAGNLYYSGALTVFTREEDVKAAGNEIAIERRLFRIHERKREVKRREWVKDHYEERTVTETYEEKEPLGPHAIVNVGDEIQVTLVITAKNDYRYLVFEDMKGAGFEPTELRSGHGFGGILTYREFRDERVVFFCSSLRQGRHELSYRLRAEIPGDYHVMPARGHAMYLPDVRATSDEWRVSISEPGVR